MYTDYKIIKEALIDMIQMQTYDLFVTLIFNTYGMSLIRAREYLKKFDAGTSQAVAGKNWSNKSEKRPIFYALVEKHEIKIHWHLLVKLIHLQQISNYIYEARKAWSKLWPPGEINIQLIEDQTKVVRYVAKSVAREVSYEEFVVPGQFHAEVSGDQHIGGSASMSVFSGDLDERTRLRKPLR